MGVFDSSAGVSSKAKLNSERQIDAEASTQARTDFKRTVQSLLARGFKADLNTRFDNSCAAHSYGEVRRFFQSSPCKWLARAYVAVSKIGLGLVVVAISLVDLPNTALAEKYKHLVDAPGTGNIRELSRDTGSYRNVRFNGVHYISGIDGTQVWNAQAQPVKPTSASVIAQILNTVRY